jgi:hypothetical protein
MNWERILVPEVLVLLIPLAGVLVGGTVAVLSLIHRHRERLAMIEQGMDADAPKGQRIVASRTPERLG